jgi:hypothetical protein
MSAPKRKRGGGKRPTYVDGTHWVCSRHRLCKNRQHRKHG